MTQVEDDAAYILLSLIHNNDIGADKVYTGYVHVKGRMTLDLSMEILRHHRHHPTPKTSTDPFGSIPVQWAGSSVTVGSIYGVQVIPIPSMNYDVVHTNALDEAELVYPSDVKVITEMRDNRHPDILSLLEPDAWGAKDVLLWLLEGRHIDPMLICPYTLTEGGDCRLNNPCAKEMFRQIRNHRDLGDYDWGIVYTYIRELFPVATRLWIAQWAEASPHLICRWISNQAWVDMNKDIDLLDLFTIDDD